MGVVEADVVHSRLQITADLARQLSEMKSARKIEILQRIISRITIHTSKLGITICPAAAWVPRDESIIDEPTTVIEVPVELKRCGMAVRLIVRTPGETTIRKPDPKLVARIAKAHKWFARLSSGQYDSIKAISQEEQVTSSYVTRVIYLAFLAPDIVQRIIQGDHPPELNTDRLIHMVPLPVAWDEQRVLLNMTS